MIAYSGTRSVRPALSSFLWFVCVFLLDGSALSDFGWPYLSNPPSLILILILVLVLIQIIILIPVAGRGLGQPRWGDLVEAKGVERCFDRIPQTPRWFPQITLPWLLQVPGPTLPPTLGGRCRLASDVCRAGWRSGGTTGAQLARCTGTVGEEAKALTAVSFGLLSMDVWHT